MPSTARPNSKKERRQENEKLILAAAEKVFAEAGFGGATMQLIADVAGLPKANLHYYVTFYCCHGTLLHVGYKSCG